MQISFFASMWQCKCKNFLHFALILNANAKLYCLQLLRLDWQKWFWQKLAKKWQYDTYFKDPWFNFGEFLLSCKNQLSNANATKMEMQMHMFFCICIMQMQIFFAFCIDFCIFAFASPISDLQMMNFVWLTNPLTN